MDVRLHQAGVELDARRFLTLRHAGTRVVCVAGELWITQDRDIRDHFLRAGETFELEVDGAVLVQAEKPSRLLLLESGMAMRAGWLGGWFGPRRLDGRPPAVVLFRGA